MKPLKEVVSERKVVKGKARSEREEMLQEFVTKINLERKGTKWKPVTGRMVAIKTAHLSKEDVRYFLKECKQAKCGFSRAFFGTLKVHA